MEEHALIDLEVALALDGIVSRTRIVSGRCVTHIHRDAGDCIDGHFNPTKDWSICGELLQLYKMDVGPLCDGDWQAEMQTDEGCIIENAGDPRVAICKVVARYGKRPDWF